MQNITAAQRFVSERFPDCDAAILAGSTTRGEGTPQSDLDIIILKQGGKTTYEESTTAYGWPIDVLFHTPTTCVKFFALDVECRRPATIHMCAHGVLLKDTGQLGTLIQAEAQRLWQLGPSHMSSQEIAEARFDLTTILDDFISARDYGESLMLAQDVLLQCIDLLLNLHHRWLGVGKWRLRELRAFEPSLEEQGISALTHFYQQGTKDNLIHFAEQTLTRAGGPLTEIQRDKPEQTPPLPTGTSV